MVGKRVGLGVCDVVSITLARISNRTKIALRAMERLHVNIILRSKDSYVTSRYLYCTMFQNIMMVHWFSVLWRYIYSVIKILGNYFFCRLWFIFLLFFK